MNKTKAIFRISSDENIELDEIFNVKVLEEVNLLGIELSSNEATFEIIDKNNDFNILNPNNKISNFKVNTIVDIYRYIDDQKIYFGRFYLNEFNRKNDTVSFKCRDIIDIISKDEIEIGQIEYFSVGEVLDIIFGEGNYEASSDIKKTIIYMAYLEKMSKSEILMRLCFYYSLVCVTARREKPLLLKFSPHFSYQDRIKYIGKYKIDSYFQNTDKITECPKYNKILFNNPYIGYEAYDNSLIYEDSSCKAGTYDISFQNGKKNYTDNINGGSFAEAKEVRDKYINYNHKRNTYESIKVVVPSDAYLKIYGREFVKYDNYEESIYNTSETDDTMDISDKPFLCRSLKIYRYAELAGNENLRKNKTSNLLMYNNANNILFDFDYDISEAPNIRYYDEYSGDYVGKEEDAIGILAHMTVQTDILVDTYTFQEKTYNQYIALAGYIEKLDIDVDTMIASISIRCGKTYYAKEV